MAIVSLIMAAVEEPLLDEERIRGFCALCRSRCGCISVVEAGRLVRVEPDPDHPTGQAICAKARAAPELVHSGERLRYPMRRTAPKGADDAGWERISWDEALNLTAQAMDAARQAGGAESVAFSVTTPSGTAMSDAIPFVERLIRGFGSPNTVYGTEICNWHKDNATAYTFGAGVGSPDYEQAGCIVHWGHNPNVSWLCHAERTAAAKTRGAKTVVVDPRRAGGAVKADQWLRVRPGYDGALALAIAGVMIERGWIDEAFLQRWSSGPFLIDPTTGKFLTGADLEAGGSADAFVAWDCAQKCAVACDPLESDGEFALAGRYTVETTSGSRDCRTAFDLYSELAQAMTPERLEAEAWVPARQVEDTARLLWENRPVSYYAWSGVGQHTNATQTDRAIALLYALTGSFDAPGGNLEHAKVPLNDVSGKDLLTPERKARGLEIGDRPLGPGRDGWVTSSAFFRAVLEGAPYQVRALMSFGTNMLVSHPDAARGREALKALEFHVHADMFMNPSAEYADVILPVCSAWEREGLRAGFEIDQEAEELVQLRTPAVAPVGESRSDIWIAFELARRLGLGDLFWGGDMDAGLSHMLEPSGIGLDALRKAPEGIRVPLKPTFRKYALRRNGARGFATRSGRVEIYSELFLENGQAPLPEFVPPAGDDSFPLVLTSAKSTLFCHSQFRQLESLRRRQPHPIVEIHPDTAAARDIQNGDWVEIETGNGRMRAVAKYSNSLDPRVVVGQQGWWQACAELGLPGYDVGPEGGGNYNALISAEHADPISGSVPLRSFTCDVRAAR